MAWRLTRGGQGDKKNHFYFFLRTKSRIFHHKRPVSRQRCKGVYPFPSLAPITMIDKNIPDFELIVNEEASENVTKNDQDMTSNKCNQCMYASLKADNLRIHLQRHSGEKANKCKQCNYATAHSSALKTHLKHTAEKSRTNATNVTMHPFMQAI